MADLFSVCIKIYFNNTEKMLSNLEISKTDKLLGKLANWNHKEV